MMPPPVVSPPPPPPTRLLLFTRTESEILSRLLVWIQHYKAAVVPGLEVLVLTAGDVPVRNADNTLFQETQGQRTQAGTSTRQAVPVEAAALTTAHTGVVEEVDQNRHATTSSQEHQITSSSGSGCMSAAASVSTPKNLLAANQDFLFDGWLVQEQAAVKRKDVATRCAEFQPDFIVSVLYPKKIQLEVLQLVPEGLAVNLHPSLLPKHRGSLCQFWPIFEGDKESGVTVHEMLERFDSGPIYHQHAIPISEGIETALSLNRKILHALELCFDWTLQLFFAEEVGGRIRGAAAGDEEVQGDRETVGLQVEVDIRNQVKAEKVARIQQARTATVELDEQKYPYHYKRFPEDGIVNEKWDRRQKDRFIRAMYFPPKPPARVRIVVSGNKVEAGEVVTTLRGVDSLSEYDQLRRAGGVPGLVGAGS
ncbi:unnamed protein product [Amoebophrya sp. A120]|nr:unnamed protein product [Amoebophrya sp. A120]|eukprot:GSA120T00000762001.1